MTNAEGRIQSILTGIKEIQKFVEGSIGGELLEEGLKHVDDAVWDIINEIEESEDGK